MVTLHITQTYQVVSRINTYFPQANVKTGSYLYLLETHIQLLEGAGEGTMGRLPSLVRKCVDNVAITICYDVMVVQIQYDSV